MLKIAFFRAEAGNIWDRLIGLRTGSEYSHVEFAFSDGTAFSASPRDGRARFKTINFATRAWRLIPVLGVNNNMEMGIKHWCQSINGRAYDWPGILGISIMRSINSPKWYFCSEVLAEGLQEANVLFSLNPAMTSPGTLHTALESWNDAYIWVTDRQESPVPNHHPELCPASGCCRNQPIETSR